MTSIKEAIKNMQKAGEAMRKAAELNMKPIFKPFTSDVYEHNDKMKEKLRQMLLSSGIPEEEHHMYELRNSDMLGMYIEKINKATKWKSINDVREKMGMERIGDPRYNEPKGAPKASEEQIEETILATEIYRQARLAIIRDQILTPEARSAILKVQAKQVAYGIDKYPEPLNANTWDTSETIDHILDESIDRLHYLVMLRIKLEQALVSGAYNDIITVRSINSRIATISRMIENNIEDMGYLIKMRILMDEDKEAKAVKAMSQHKCCCDEDE